MSDYATTAEFRSYTSLDVNELTDTQVSSFISQAMQRLKRDVYIKITREDITPDANGYFFPKSKYFADSTLNNSIGVDDIEVWLWDTTYNTASELPSTNVSTIDGTNNYFTMDSTYSASTNLKVSYWIVNKPHDDATYDLKEACIFYAAFLAFRYVKVKRLKGGIVNFNLGKLNIVRDEREFDLMVQDWLNRYNHKVSELKAFHSKTAAEGKAKSRGIWGFLSSNHPNTPFSK